MTRVTRLRLRKLLIVRSTANMLSFVNDTQTVMAFQDINATEFVIAPFTCLRRLPIQL